MNTTLWQQMNQLHLSRYRLAERSSVSFDEISVLCAGGKPLTQCSEETQAKLAKALELSGEELRGMTAGTATYMMVCGDAMDTLYHEADQGGPPEEILTKEHLAELFLSAAEQFGRKTEKRAHYENRCQKEGDGASLSEFICERVFRIGKNKSVLQEYLSLKEQIGECLDFLSKNSKLLGQAREPKGKAKYLIDAATKRKKSLEKRSKPAALVMQALWNVTSGPLDQWLYRDFRMEIPWFCELERDHRTAIFFGDLPLQSYRKLMKLAQSDHETYLDTFETLILTRDIPKQLRRRTERNIYLHDRAAIMRTAVKLFEAEDYQPFVYLLVPQIEGLLRIYQGILSCDADEGGETSLGMKAVADRINDLGYFLEYTYFAFDFCDELRNPVAHGRIIEVDRERAYEVLMDAWWLVKKIDAPDCGYQRWMKLIRDCAGHKDYAQTTRYLLDAFSGMDRDKNMALLRRHLRHGFEKELAWSGLTEEAKRIDSLLQSQSFYDRIWNGAPAQYTDETMELAGEIINVRNLENDSEKHRKLADLLHQLGVAPEDWYDRYIRYCEERRREFDDMLSKLVAEKDRPEQETAVQTAEEN